jgi:hypothetical protein
MSGQQNPNYILANNQIIMIYSTVIGQIIAEEYVYLVIGLSMLVKIWGEQEQDSAHESLTKNLKLEIGVYIVLVLQVCCS